MEKRSKLRMRELQAKYWHAFAFLAVHGKRDWKAYQFAMLSDPPEQCLVDSILAEAARFKRAS